MDYIDSLLIMEGDLDNANGDDNDDDETEVPGPAVEDSVGNEPPPPIPQERQGPRVYRSQDCKQRLNLKAEHLDET